MIKYNPDIACKAKKKKNKKKTKKKKQHSNIVKAKTEICKLFFIYVISLFSCGLPLKSVYTCCSHSGSEDDPDQNNFQKNFTKT